MRWEYMSILVGTCGPDYSEHLCNSRHRCVDMDGHSAPFRHRPSRARLPRFGDPSYCLLAVEQCVTRADRCGRELEGFGGHIGRGFGVFLFRGEMVSAFLANVRRHRLPHQVSEFDWSVLVMLIDGLI